MADAVEDQILVKSGQDLMKTLTKEAYFAASDAVADRDQEQSDQLRLKALNMSGLRGDGAVEVVSSGPNWKPEVQKEAAGFVRSNPTPQIDAERDQARRNAAELRRAAERAERGGDARASFEFRRSSERADFYADQLQSGLMRKLSEERCDSLTFKLPVPATLYGRNLSAKLAVSRMGRPVRMARVHLGQYEDPAAAEAKILGLITTMPFWPAFVKFVLDSVPDYLVQQRAASPDYIQEIVVFDEWHVLEALKSFELNYASKQDARRAASWGVRFPSDMRADFAFSRVEFYAGDYYESMLRGQWDGAAFDFDAQAGAVAAQNLGPNPTIVVENGQFNIVNNLTSSTSLQFYWYAHVYRALQVFVPVLSKMLLDSEQEPSLIYDVFTVPELSDSPAFILWTVCANTFMYQRINSPASLRGLLSNDLLLQVKDGFDDAAKIYQAEAWFLQQAGKQIQAEIDLLSSIQFIMQILAIPGQVIQNLPELAKIPTWYWIAGGVGAVAILGGVLYILRG